MTSEIITPKRKPIRVAIAGLGAIGLAVARAIDEGLENYTLGAVSARNHSAAADRLHFLKTPVPIVPLEELENCADIVIECAPAELLPKIAEPFLKSQKTVIVLSSGALLANSYLIDMAAKTGGKIIVPSGALLGLDAVSAAAEGNIESVEMVTRKPVRGLVGAPHLIENNIDITQLTEPLKVFDGTAGEAAIGFPANLNVAVALSLAGIGPERTKLQIWADPNLTLNTHKIVVKSDSANFEMSIVNIPTENPKTGRITSLSVIAALRNLNGPIRIGT
ncbi:MAG: aspartate dehydrogenase [Rhizobiaceae bacterium]